MVMVSRRMVLRNWVRSRRAEEVWTVYRVKMVKKISRRREACQNRM